MSSYKLYEGSSDLIQNDGTALVNSETVVDGGTAMGAGNVATNGPLDSVDTINTGRYGGVNVGGVDSSVGAANWNEIDASASVAEGTGANAGRADVTSTGHGLSVGDTVRVTDGSNVYTGVHRVIATPDANSLILNTSYVSDVGTASLSKGVAVSATDSTVKTIGYQAPGRYAARVIGLPVYNGTATVNALASPASDYGRRKVHSRTAVRSRLVETAIRAGYWNIFTGTFSTAPTVQDDFSAMGADGEVADNPVSKSNSVGGEFAYRYGITVTQDQYEH